MLTGVGLLRVMCYCRPPAITVALAGGNIVLYAAGCCCCCLAASAGRSQAHEQGCHPAVDKQPPSTARATNYCYSQAR